MPAQKLLDIAEQLNISRRRRPRPQAGRDLRAAQGADPPRRRRRRRRRAGNPARRLRLPARGRGQLPRRPGRHLHLAQPDPPLQPAHRRPPVRPHPLPEGRRALLRAERSSTRINGEPIEASKNKVLFENLTAAVPAPQVQARARRRQHRGHHRPHPRPDGAAGQRPARADRVAAESRQDHDDAAGRHRDHAQPPRRAPDRAADRRASRGSHRHAAHRARRGDLLDVRRARRRATCRSPRW